MKNLLLFNRSQMNGTEYICQKEISAEAIYFEGHYPGNPVFPGVFQIELAVGTAGNLLFNMMQKKLLLVKIDKFRFLETVAPGDVVTVRAKLKAEVENGWCVAVDLHAGEHRVSSGVLTLGEYRSETVLREGEARPAESIEKGKHMGVGDIVHVLPHRYPFLQIDRVIALISGQKVTSVKNITASDYMLWGREAGAPLPKSIIIEALAQTAAILGLEVMGNSDRLPLFGVISNAIFASEAYPGDQLIMEAVAERALSDRGIYTGRAWVGNRLVCEIEKLIFALR